MHFASLPFLLAALVLPAATASFFQPLSCNANLQSLPCTKWSSLTFDISQKVTIPCGSCVEMDQSGALNLVGGLDVEGKLVFPANRQALEITTPFIFVQGELTIEELQSPMIPQVTQMLQFHLTGSQDIMFVSHSDQTSTKCTGGGCNVSTKPIVVAGGKLDIQGMHATCPTWSRLVSIENEQAPVISNLPSAPQPQTGCNSWVVSEAFNATDPELQWDGLGAGSTQVVSEGGESFLRVQQRTSGTQGPRVFLPVDCLTPNVPYVVKYRYRMTSTTASTEFGVPYLKMIHNSDWRSPDFLFSRGSIGSVQSGVWQQVELALTFTDSMVDSTQTSSLALYVSPFDDGSAVVDLDSFQLELAPLGDTTSGSCDAMLANSQEHAFPFSRSGGVLTTEEDGTGNHFLRSSLRTSRYQAALAHNLPLDCLLNGAVYELEARVKVHSPTSRVVNFNLWTDDGDGIRERAIATCPPSSNGWVLCKAKFTLPINLNAVSSARLVALAASDDDSIIDFEGLSFNYVQAQSRTKMLVLEDASSIQNCWGPGAELIVTSHTLQHEDAQEAIVDSVDPSTGKITLVDAIHVPITMEDDTQTAVEVVLLSRNILLTAEEEPALIGGHMIVMHTQVPQNIVGLEIQGFGQQGNLGRYPLHFHMCFSSAGTLVAKNTVRDSHQRGYVVHGTHDLVLNENVAYNTKGHVFMLEDGGEQNNTFYRNLGAKGHGVENRISDAESDNNPSIFWITNPVNTFIDNIAAGSSFSGFWFEVKARVRGPSAAYYPDMNPSMLPLTTFTGNVAHSNANGLQTYPQTGYRPPVRAVFDNFKSFRNREAGVFFHAGGLLGINNSYFSDNNRYAVEIDADHSDTISNSVIVGASQAYRQVVERYGLSAYQWPAKAFCSNGDTPMIGVELDSYHSGGEKTGTSLLNVQFSGFDDAICPESSSLVVGAYGVQFFDPRNSLEQVTVTDGSPLVNLCSTSEQQVAIHDKDGAFSGVAGFIVSDTNAIKADPACASLPGTCAAICSNVCLRSMQILLPSYIPKDSPLQLEIAGTTSGSSPISPIVVKNFETKDLIDLTAMSSHRRFFVTLPSGGSYTGRFTENGNVVWPGDNGGYVDMSYTDEPDACGPDFASFSIETPARECNEIIVNGGMGDSIGTGSIDHWRHIGGSTSVVAVTGGADGTSFSLLTENDVSSGGRWAGMAQYLDTRCIEEGYIYDFDAKIKLTNVDGTPFVCNLNGYPEDAQPCARANLRSRNGLSDNEYEWTVVANMQENNQEWNTLSGTFSASAFDAAANHAVIYVSGVPAGVDIQLDQVSLVRREALPSTAPSTSPSLSPSDSPVSPVPTESPVASGPQSSSDFSGTNTCTWRTDGAVRCSTQTSEEATIVSTLPHTGVDNGDDTVEFSVKFLDRQMPPDGVQDSYQPGVVLFFAPQDAELATLTTNDNGYHFFESAVVADVKEKIYYNSANPNDLVHTWFSFNSLDTNEDTTSSAGSAGYRMFAGGQLKIRRHSGVVSAHHSSDGVSFTQIGSSVQLPTNLRDAPLKVGMRMKRDWKPMYDLTLLPSIVSGGTVNPTTPAATDSPSAFTESNCESTGTISFAANGAVTMESTSNQVSVLLSDETYSNDVTLTVKMLSRDVFGTAYQGGAVLFFASSSTDFSDSALHANTNTYGNFEQSVAATLKDKVHATIDHTYVTLHSQDSSNGGATTYQNGGYSYKNDGGGFLRLERRGGFVYAYHSPNGSSFARIGSAVELPNELKIAPIKIGMRVSNNWNSSYKMTVLPTIEQPTRRRRSMLRRGGRNVLN